MKQLAVYFALAYGIGWLIWLPLYGHIFGITDLPKLPFHHGIGALSPLIASLLTTWIFYKKAGVKTLVQNIVKIRPLSYLAIAAFTPFILAIIASCMSYFIDGAPINLRRLLYTHEFPEFSFATFFIYNLVFFGFGEEVGWRGFALPHLQKKYKALASSIILTIFWAGWHIPLFFYRAGFTSMDAGTIAGWVFSLLTGSILLTWLYNASKQSIFICAVFHSTIDIAFTGDIANPNIVNYMGMLITMWGVATILIFKSANLTTLKTIKK